MDQYGAPTVYLKPRVSYGTDRLYIGNSTRGYVANALATLLGRKRTLSAPDIIALRDLNFDVRCEDCGGHVTVNLNNKGAIECGSSFDALTSIWHHT